MHCYVSGGFPRPPACFGHCQMRGQQLCPVIKVIVSIKAALH